MKCIFFLVVCTAVFSGDLFSASDFFDPNNKRTYIEDRYGNNELHVRVATRPLDNLSEGVMCFFMQQVNEVGDTPLHVAVRFDFVYGVSAILHYAQLLDKSAYSSFLLKKNFAGQTALMLARSIKPSNFNNYLPKCVEQLEFAEKALKRGES